MKFGRILAAVAVAATALLVAPASHAATPDAPQNEWEIESVTRPGDVWDQSNWAWDPEYPIVAHPRHGEDNQTWYISDDGTIKNKRYEWCATAVGGDLAGRRCNGSEDQRWVGHSYDNYHSWLFELGDSGRCVTHNGVYKELTLAPCERERSDQRWIIHKR
ncbi:ricin-type beta-trefoil lectin domain protein [Actinosynnema sp. NPDC047251]|uniref:Putative secreted protein n=1 Tax=Saccharothrix espanaensis (strain ATCC 51144 / DSM 44229 / JCM 9112 / NBRC 15066 / NRRL 15764) TaxID=1179773 RepID=K0K924_SACES|nr:ricin-type beta-trefoil lectin domain protein [Saccharothrix espanaensis]CCH34876.1 putative secreted protein [Saccharothrix espanaensis DSM 44229]